MKMTRNLAVFAAVGLGLVAAGCDSGSSCADGGVCADAGSKGGASGAGGAGGNSGLFAVTPGTYCFEIVSIAPGAVDGCDLGVASLVSTVAKPSALPVTYYAAATTTAGGVAIPKGTIEVGTDGSIGRGVVDKNVATLLRVGTAMLPAPDQACTWNQMDTSAFQLTAENTFTVAVSETESTFAPACGVNVPPSDPCTSTWTWTMKILSPQTLMAVNGCK